SGKAIFADEDVYAGYRKRRHGGDLVVAALQPLDVPPAAIEVLAKALAFDPTLRLARVEDLAHQLTAALDPPAGLPASPPTAEATRPPASAPVAEVARAPADPALGPPPPGPASSGAPQQPAPPPQQTAPRPEPASLPQPPPPTSWTPPPV